MKTYLETLGNRRIRTEGRGFVVDYNGEGFLAGRHQIFGAFPVIIVPSIS